MGNQALGLLITPDPPNTTKKQINIYMYIYSMPTKKETIETVYFRPDGFGSLKQVTKDAQAKNETVTSVLK